MTGNTNQRQGSARAYVRNPDFLAGWREALRGDPPDYDARASTGPATRYEMGRQLAIWQQTRGLSAKRPTPPSPSQIRSMNADTGLPRIVGVNA